MFLFIKISLEVVRLYLLGIWYKFKFVIEFWIFSSICVVNYRINWKSGVMGDYLFYIFLSFNLVLFLGFFNLIVFKFYSKINNN